MKNTKLRSIAGFTLDQTILVVAVIAVLATIIISSVAWNVFNKANAAKLTAHLTQIADSYGEHYRDEESKWPANAAALAPYLAGYTISGTNLITPFGTDAVTSTLTALVPNYRLGATGATGGGSGCVPSTSVRDCYKIFRISSVEEELAIATDRTIDGASSTSTTGRVRYSGLDANGRVTVTYYAVPVR